MSVGPLPALALKHRDGIVAVNGDAGYVVGRAAIGDVLDGLVAILAHGNAVVVVLADEDNGELPDRGHVQRLMESALVGGAVAEEAGTDLIGAADLGGQARADRDVVARAHDAVGAQDAQVSIRNVHRAALALAVAGVAAEELGHHEIQIAALGDDVAVATVGRRDEVIIPQALAHRRSDRFLTQIQVGKAVDLALGEQILGCRLESTDAAHAGIDVFHLFSAYCHLKTSYRNTRRRSRSRRPLFRGTKAFVL